MSMRKCGCIYATSANTDSVRKGFEMGGYIKEPCPAHNGKRYRIVDSPEGGIETVLESYDNLEEAESRLAYLIDDGDNCDLYLSDAEGDL